MKHVLERGWTKRKEKLISDAEDRVQKAKKDIQKAEAKLAEAKLRLTNANQDLMELWNSLFPQ